MSSIVLHVLTFSELVIKKRSTKELFCTSGQNLWKIPAKEIIFSKAAGLNHDKVSNCTKRELLHRYFSIFLIIDGSWNRTFIFAEHIPMATSHLTNVHQF